MALQRTTQRVDVPRQHNIREENADIKKGAILLTFGKKDKNGNCSKLSQKDTDGRVYRLKKEFNQPSDF